MEVHTLSLFVKLNELVNLPSLYKHMTTGRIQWQSSDN